MTFAFQLVSTLESPSFWQNLMHASHVQSYWAKCNATRMYYSTSHTSCLGEKDAPGEATSNHACTWRSPPPLWSDLPTCCHWFFWEKIKLDTFWTGFVYDYKQF
jgi:hypothetical protein